MFSITLKGVPQRSYVKAKTDQYPASYNLVVAAGGVIYNLNSTDTDLTKIPLDETVVISANVERIINTPKYLAFVITAVDVKPFKSGK